jgi:SAM-dependent methyltransferase
MRRSLEKEMMDLPNQPKELLQQDLRNLTIINRYLGGYRGVMRAVARLVEEQKLARFSLLDVGAGSGDIPARIAARIRKKRIAARLVALETEPVTVAVAAEKTRDYPEISLVQGDAMALPHSYCIISPKTMSSRCSGRGLRSHAEPLSSAI